MLAAAPGSKLDRRAHLLAGTSTIVENYIGEASKREQDNRSQCSRNRNFQMAMHEANVSEKLRLLRKFKPNKFHRVLAKARRLRPLIIRRFKRRARRRLKRKVESMEVVRNHCHELKAKRLELHTRMKKLAIGWQRDLLAATTGSFGVDAVPRNADVSIFEVLIPNMLAAAVPTAAHTDSELLKARRAWLTDRVTMCHLMHDLHQVIAPPPPPPPPPP